MNKWRFLLLSVLSLLQSASTEQNFVDGRNRYRWSDTRFSGRESYRLLGHRQLDIPNEQSNLVRNVELTTPALRSFRRTELRWLPSVQDKYDGTDCVTRFRIRAHNDRNLNRHSTPNLNKASDVGRHTIVRDFTDRDYRKNIGSISSFRNNNDKSEDTRLRLNDADRRRNYDDMLNRYKRNSRDAITNDIRTRMYDGHTNFLNRDRYTHDDTKRAFRERVFLERVSKEISLYEEPEGRRQITKTFDSIYNSNNERTNYRSSSEDVTRRTLMNQNNKEKDISRYNFLRKSRSHNYMRNKLVGKATLYDESCIANTRESKLETTKDAGETTRRNNARRIAISEFSIRDGSRVFCPEELNSKILNTRTVNIILRKNIQRDIPNYRSRDLTTQIRIQNKDVYNRNIQERSSTQLHNSFSRDIHSTNVFSTGVSGYIINTDKNNFQDNKRNSKQEITLTEEKTFSPEATQRDTLKRSQRLSIRQIQSNKVQNIRKIRNLNIENRQRNNKNENQMENISIVRRERINNIHLNNREKHFEKRFVTATLSNRNSCNDRSRSLSTQETRRNTNKLGCTSNKRDEKILNNLRLNPVSRMKQQFSNLYHNERTTETSELTRRERSRSVSIGEAVANRIKNKNTQQNLNVQRVTVVREKQNLRPKLHVSKKMEERIEHINRERSTLLSAGNLERARSMLRIDPVSRKQSIPTREDNTNENRNIHDKRYRTLLIEENIRNIIHSNRNTPARSLQRSQSRLSSERQYLISKLSVTTNTKYTTEVVHQDRSRSLPIEKRARTEDIREERSLRKRSITPLNGETQQIRDMERNRGRSAINGRQSTNEIRHTQNIRKYQNVQLFTLMRNEKQNSISKRYQIPSRSDRTQSDRERITNRIHVIRYVQNTRIPNERREIISSRQNSNPTIVLLVNRKENTNEFRLNDFRSLSTEKRITNQIMNIRHVREVRLQDMRYRTPINREKRGMLSHQRERITSELERTIYNERRQNTQVSSSERHSTTKLYVRQLEHSDNNRQDKLRSSFTRERTTNEIQHSGYSRKERQNNENIPKLYSNERSIVKTDRNNNRYRIISGEDKLEREITRHIKVNRFVTRQRITPLNRDSVFDKDLQINTRHMTNVGDIRNLYQSTIHRTNEYNIRDRITDIRRISLSTKRQCTSLQCSMSTSVINDTQIENVFEFKWQLLFYLLQGIYLWNLFIKNPKTNGESYKNGKFPNWFTAMNYMKIH